MVIQQVWPSVQQTDLQYLLINMISHLATAVDHKVSQDSYMAQSSELGKQQQAHVVR